MVGIPQVYHVDKVGEFDRYPQHQVRAVSSAGLEQGTSNSQVGGSSPPRLAKFSIVDGAYGRAKRLFWCAPCQEFFSLILWNSGNPLIIIQINAPTGVRPANLIETEFL